MEYREIIILAWVSGFALVTWMLGLGLLVIIIGGIMDRFKKSR